MGCASGTRQFRIAIDGPAGAGKTTLATLLAKTLGFSHINTGMIYRALSYVLMERFPERSIQELESDIRKEDAKILEVIKGFSPNITENSFVADGKNIIHELRTPRIDAVVGIISKYKIVREKVKIIQKKLINMCPMAVVEGRDIGSAIMPDAELKIYLEASVEERAIRREKERSEKKDRGEQTPISLEEIEMKIKQRDFLDTTREISPLVKSPDAIVIDNTKLTVEETVKKIQDIFLQRQQKD
ncbi:CMP/dCMP kinase [Nematocida minor]|uniref:CMP/dCMP kinase n=1 Tax=Nematocida minor TaxID=1912983 RepID=UPI00221EC5B9|nr:CMP/dCMP kinase [Nematocida minor]KAI5189678.1 CMP/dCMP kinase [Nematocida minor]